MSYLVKGLVGAAGCSGVCGGGYFVVNYLSWKEDSRPMAKTLIANSGRTLLNAGSDQWAARWSEYVSATGNLLGIDGYEEKAKNVSKAPEEFKNACLSKVNEKVSGEEDKLFQALAKHCVQMTTISELINSVGKVALNTASGQDGSEWKTSWSRYVNNSEDNKWGLENWDSEKVKQEAPEAFKTKCGTKKGGNVFGVKDVEFQNYVDWCTKDKPEVSSVG
ncbi:hypothetical protein MHC_04705 [Mycoplasma haemocanis str. Illinois]|uniref:Uncharacterized protein n=1 Tax=Mycoplasma haemocanis (strain Illinois) TaxID=1111676 RepID=H6N825_MYCHN|nr:hypothetical protein [Mycoplasma haemocanis]AEW45797.1 hypothetical protein MHC_04705 [Mycoplasma haemocanis str. Illinois]